MNSKLDLQPKAFGYNTKMDPGEVPVPGKYKFVLDIKRADDQDSNVGGNLSIMR